MSEALLYFWMLAFVAAVGITASLVLLVRRIRGGRDDSTNE